MKIKLDALDRLFSLYIRKRARGYCERCKRYFGVERLQCSHFYGRRARSVRYDPDNACALCFSCHIYLGENPREHTRFFRDRLGDRLDQLEARWSIPQKPDRQAIRLWLKEELKKYET